MYGNEPLLNIMGLLVLTVFYCLTVSPGTFNVLQCGNTTRISLIKCLPKTLKYAVKLHPVQKSHRQSLGFAN